MQQLTRALSLVVVGIAVAAAPSAVAAQSTFGTKRDDVRHATGDVWAMWTSPARATSGDLPPLLGAAAVVGASGFADSALWNWMTHHQQTLVIRTIRPIREGWTLPFYEFGSGQVILPLSGLAYTWGRLSHSVPLRDLGLGCAAGHLTSAGLREIAYLAVSRARPRVTDDPYKISFPGSNDWSWHSFLSGHIANSMSCASFIGHRYSLGKGAIVPYGVSTAIGFGRMVDGRHWLSDTMTGALLGFTIGKAIAGRQLERESRAAPSAASAASAQRGTSIPVFRVSIDF